MLNSTNSHGTDDFVVSERHPMDHLRFCNLDNTDFLGQIVLLGEGSHSFGGSAVIGTSNPDVPVAAPPQPTQPKTSPDVSKHLAGQLRGDHL